MIDVDCGLRKINTVSVQQARPHSMGNDWNSHWPQQGGKLVFMEQPRWET